VAQTAVHVEVVGQVLLRTVRSAVAPPQLSAVGGS
jgi:hypothetical protein